MAKNNSNKKLKNPP